MMRVANPAVEALREAVGGLMEFGEVLVRPEGAGWELRHRADHAAAPATLREETVAGLRALANHRADGAFRPLKSAPTLRAGWRAWAADLAALETALDNLYPGALADWFAVRQGNPPVTSFRDYVNRQTGMYRLAQKLSDEQAGVVIRAGCPPEFCLKRRLWTVPGQPVDEAGAKSVIPCLEPCPMVLEFARKSMRMEQREPVLAALYPDDLETLAAVLEHLGSAGSASGREADFGSPDNPRRIRRLWERVQHWRTQVKTDEPKGA